MIVVDPLYNPNLVPFIDGDTEIAHDITLNTFLGSYGNRTSIDHITDQETRRALARQLYLHGEVLNITRNNKQFDMFNCVVAESVYRPGLQEVIIPDSISAKKIDGRTVVYQLFNSTGQIDISASYDLALFWKDYINFQYLSLQYDLIDPTGIPGCSIVVEMPQVDESFNIVNRQDAIVVDTNLNGTKFAQAELLELLFA